MLLSFWCTKVELFNDFFYANKCYAIFQVYFHMLPVGHTHEVNIYLYILSCWYCKINSMLYYKVLNFSD